MDAHDPPPSSSRHARGRTAWAGLYVGALAWGVHHQVGSDLVYFDCTRFGPALVIGLGLACAAVALGGGWVSWSARAGLVAPHSAGLRFGALMSALGATLFALVILAQTAAGLFFGGCEL